MGSNISTIHLRQLRVDDKDLSPIAAQLGGDDWDPALNENHPEHLQRFLENGGIFLLAYIDGVLVGRAYGYFNVHPNGEHELYIDEVDTKVNYRRRGVGQALISGMKDQGRKLGATNIWLGTEPDNIPANGLYQSIKDYEQETFVMYTWTLETGTTESQQTLGTHR